MFYVRNLNISVYKYLFFTHLTRAAVSTLDSSSGKLLTSANFLSSNICSKKCIKFIDLRCITIIIDQNSLFFSNKNAVFILQQVDTSSKLMFNRIKNLNKIRLLKNLFKQKFIFWVIVNKQNYNYNLNIHLKLVVFLKSGQLLSNKLVLHNKCQ